MTTSAIGARVGAFFVSAKLRVRALWRWYRARKLWQQGALLLLVLAIIIVLFTFLHSSTPDAQNSNQERTVTLKTINELSGQGGSVDAIGTVRSITEANVLAQNGGVVRAVHTALGRAVPAGFILAEVDNAAESASVLQAQGAYEAAVAARSIAQRQAQNSTQSKSEADVSGRNVYQSAYASLDTTLHTNVDTFFGDPTPTGPYLIINSNQRDTLQRTRASISDQMDEWKGNLASAPSRTPDALLDEAEAKVRSVSNFLTLLATAANQRNSDATAAQLTALATARASVEGQLATLSAARNAWRAAVTAAQVGQDQTQSSSQATASVDAAVKQALGALRGAQANFEKTIVRAPIAGTVNFLPIRVGDYVTPLMHVATVAQNGALEIVAYVSQDTRQQFAAGTAVTIDGKYKGVVTSISPALDPVSKQIEVHVATVGSNDLVNGQSVHIGIPSATPAAHAAGPTTLPLSAVKLLADRRVVFTVSDGRLVAQQVEVGDVQGDRIEVTTPLAADLRIVMDARGLAEGEKVQVAQ